MFRVKDRLMNYLLAHELFTKINHKPFDLYYKLNIFNNFCPIISSYLQYNLSVKGFQLDLQTLYIQMEAFKS